MSTGNISLSKLDKYGIVNMIEATKIDLLEREKKMENFLKDTNCDSSQLEKHINMCFESRWKLEDCLEKLKEQELKDDYTGSSCPLMDFVLSISNVKDVSSPEALIVVTSEMVAKRYIKLIRRLDLEKVMISTIRALTAGDVNVTLKYVKSVLWDGSEEAYQEYLGSVAVRLAISSHVPTDRMYYVRSDSYRDECFEVTE